MFDNPKKELERIQAQLLAAEDRAEAEDSFYSDTEEFFDDDLSFLSDTDMTARSAGFDIPDEPYEMDTDRYVPARKKKSLGFLLFITILEILAAAALFAWWLGWLG